MFMYHWTIQYRIPDYALTEKGTQFINKLFELLHAFPGTKHLMTTCITLRRMMKLKDSMRGLLYD